MVGTLLAFCQQNWERKFLESHLESTGKKQRRDLRHTCKRENQSIQQRLFQLPRTCFPAVLPQCWVRSRSVLDGVVVSARNGRHNSEEKQQRTAERGAQPQTSSSSPGSEHPQAPPRLPLPRQVFTLMLFTANTAHRTCCCAEGSCQYFACQDKEESALLRYWSHHRAQSCVIAPSFLPHISPQCTCVTQMLLSILSLAEGLTVHRKYPMVDADKMWQS